jgi:tRNA pseudouridine38-40 synthase
MSNSSECRAKRVHYDRSNPLQRRFRAQVSYDGTAYNGWMTQLHSGVGIQDVLEDRLSKLFGGNVRIAGSGRTDAGVHALGQVFHFEPPVERDPSIRIPPPVVAALTASDETLASVLERLLGGSNSGLPEDIQVFGFTPVSASFHARDSCIKKRYVYTIQEGAGSPMTSRFRWMLGKDKRLNVPAMEEAASRLLGEHDFSSFGVRHPSDPRTPIKILTRLEVVRTSTCNTNYSSVEQNDEFDKMIYSDSVVTITAECDRFLYHMMRMISGTLVEVGLGRLTPDDITTLLENKGRTLTLSAVKAPAKGLCLHKCFYNES